MSKIVNLIQDEIDVGSLDSMEEVESITPVKSIKEVKSIQEVSRRTKKRERDEDLKLFVFLKSIKHV